MNSLNKVQLIGNVTAKPDIRETPNGQKVATFGIATTRVWKDAAGSKQEQTEFHNVVVWRGLADVVEKYVDKGHKLYVEGYLQTRSWEDQTGAKRYRTEIVIDELIMLTSKGSATGSHKSDDEEEMPEFPEGKPAARKKAPKKDDQIHIEDIPF